MGVRVVGLDIGAEQVRAVALQKQRHQCILTGVGLRAIPQRADDEVVAQAVKVALRDTGAGKNAAVCAAIGGPEVLVKGLQLPRIPLPRVLEAVRWNLREHGLLPVGGAFLDAQVMSTSAEGQMQILAVCAPQELVEQRLQILARAGVVPQKMDVEPLALLNAVLAMHEMAMDETLVFLSLAPALICVHRAAAGAPLIRYLENQPESVADMVAEIRTAVAYFQSQLGAGSAIRVVYCGPQSACAELQEAMQGLLALWSQRAAPILFDPLARLAGTARVLALAGTARALTADKSIDGSQFAQAVGLAMRAL